MSVDDEMTWVLDAMRDRQARNAELLARFEQLTAADRRAATLVSYVCDAPQGCPLLAVWADPGNPTGQSVRCWYAPSHAPADEQTPEQDACAGLLSDVLDDGRPIDGVGLTLNCKHIRDLMLPSSELAADLADATPDHPKQVVVTRPARPQAP